MAQKTEKATPKKLKDARKKGQVAKSQDFPSALTFVVAIFSTLFATGYIYNKLAGYIITMFRSITTDIDLTNRAGGFMYEAILIIFSVSIPIMIVVSLIGVVTNFLVIGPLFSFEAMKFQWKKLNPIEGIKQKFKLKTLVELIKSILKIIGAGVIIYIVIKNSLPKIMALVQAPPLVSALFLDDYLKTIAIRVGLFFLAVAVFDLAFQKKDFSKQMMMEKFEVKQELKDTEGNPEIKGRRKEISREIAYQEGPSAARRARAIITNPIHIAVAVDYNEDEHPAPLILTMGKGLIADKIIKIAQANHIPIMRNPTLAQTLFQKGTIMEYIPEDTYEAVAEILKWISTLEDNPDINKELLIK
jgi:type III secretion protein U